MDKVMHRAQILLEPEQHQMLAEIARQEQRSLSAVVRDMLAQQLTARKKKALASAAKVLLSDYQTDKELTAFTVLDQEDFHA